VPISGKEMLKRFLKNGWILIRINGSHHIVEKYGLTQVIPVHGNKSLGKGLETKLLKSLDK
jgi:predicted RNA binding protein YcfA (HicA-like mRNA interferase family)